MTHHCRRGCGITWPRALKPQQHAHKVQQSLQLSISMDAAKGTVNGNHDPEAGTAEPGTRVKCTLGQKRHAYSVFLFLCCFVLMKQEGPADLGLLAAVTFSAAFVQNVLVNRDRKELMWEKNNELKHTWKIQYTKLSGFRVK